MRFSKKRIGNYLIGKTIGEGAFAKVKEGLHVLTGEKVIGKSISMTPFLFVLVPCFARPSFGEVNCILFYTEIDPNILILGIGSLMWGLVPESK